MIERQKKLLNEYSDRLKNERATADLIRKASDADLVYLMKEARDKKCLDDAAAVDLRFAQSLRHNTINEFKFREHTRDSHLATTVLEVAAPAAVFVAVFFTWQFFVAQGSTPALVAGATASGTPIELTQAHLGANQHFPILNAAEAGAGSDSPVVSDTSSVSLATATTTSTAVATPSTANAPSQSATSAAQSQKTRTNVSGDQSIERRGGNNISQQDERVSSRFAKSSWAENGQFYKTFCGRMAQSFATHGMQPAHC